MPVLTELVALLRMATQDRTQLVLENIALRHQLAVYKRSVGRPNINDRDRTFWLTVMRMLKGWRDAVVIVQPATVIKCHRNGFRYYWRRKSRSKPGRPPIAMAVIMLIRRMSSENVTWGAPRIRDELALLGHEVAVSTVAKYMVRTRQWEPDHSWTTLTTTGRISRSMETRRLRGRLTTSARSPRRPCSAGFITDTRGSPSSNRSPVRGEGVS